MKNIFIIRKNSDPCQLFVRDLKPGMTVPLGDKMVTVKSVGRLEPPRIIADGKPSAMALKVEFFDHEPITAHPGEIVAMRSYPKVEMTADDYAYRFPDHWIDHEKKSGSLFEKLHRAYVAQAVEIIKSSGAKTVLEVGCGDGWNCGEMVKAGLDVVGIDWSQNAVLYASMFVPDAKFYRGDVRDAEFLNLFPDKFDALALIEVLEHIPPNDCISAMSNIATPLKSGGTFVLTTPSVNHPNNEGHLHYQHFTEEKLRQIAKEAGLTVQSIEGYGDVSAARSYWNRMRWIDNRIFSIKPAVQFLTEKYHRETNLRSTPLDRCHGFIMTMRKP